MDIQINKYANETKTYLQCTFFSGHVLYFTALQFSCQLFYTMTYIPQFDTYYTILDMVNQ